MWCVLFSSCFQDFFLYHWVTRICSFMVIFENSVGGFFKFWDQWVNILYQFLKIFFSIFFLCLIPFHLSFWDSSYTVFSYLILSHRSPILCLGFSFFIFLCVRNWIISTCLSLKSQTPSFLVFRLFLSPKNKLLILCFADVPTLGEVPAERAEDTESLVEMEVLSSLNEMREIVGGMALWRQQICAIARVRLLKLKHERKALLSLWVAECHRFRLVNAFKNKCKV